MGECRLIDRLENLRTPTLLVEGARSLYVPLRYSLATAIAIRGCLVHVFHNVGHDPFMEMPDDFAALVDEFIVSDLPDD
jgi:pimeloyl-ACP methyl ester carboxylesterase